MTASNTVSARQVSIVAAIALALFCVQIDYFAVILAIPRMAADLDTTATDLQWVVSAYMLALGAGMVPGGRLGDLLGRRRILLLGIGLFGVASALCAVAPTAALLIAARVVQGLGAALIFPVSVSVLTNAFPIMQAGRAIGIAYGVAGLGNAAGPLIGGALTEALDWRWIFWLNVPLTLVAGVLVATSVSESSNRLGAGRIDFAGLALVTGGVGLFTLAFDRAAGWGWTSIATIVAFAGAVGLLSVFVVVEKRIRNPLLDLALIRKPLFAVLVAAGAVANVAYAVTIFCSTLYLQQVRELDPLAAGLVFLGPSFGAAWGGALSGLLATRKRPPVRSGGPRHRKPTPPRPPARVMGIACIAAGIALVALSASRTWIAYVPALTLCGFTLGLIYAFTTVATQSTVPVWQAGAAAGITLTTLITLAGAGVAVTASTLELRQADGVTLETAIGNVLAPLALCLALCGGAVLLATRARTGGAR